MSANYVPLGNRAGPFPEVLTTTVSPSPPLSGFGSPQGVVPGVPGQSYQDLNNQQLWMKMAGTLEMGWRLVGQAPPWSLIVVPNSGFVSGSLALGNGVDSGSISGLMLSFTPSRVLLSVSRPMGGLNIEASVVSGSISNNGFQFELSGLTDSTSYVLNYVLFP